MGYLFLSFSLLAGAAKGYCGKKLGSFAANIKSAVFLNFFRMILCVVFGILLTAAYNDLGYITLNPELISISALSGITTSVFVVTWLMAVRNSAYMMLDVFLMLGTLVPMIAGYFTFGERISAKQWIGFFILIIAVLIMCSYNNSVKIKLTVASVMLLTVCGLSNGLTDFSQKMFVKVFPDVPASVFNLYTYIFASITLAVVYFFFTSKEKAEFEAGTCVKYIYILIMSLALIANSYFKTKAASFLNSAQLYPLSQGSALILSTFMASVFFKEKFTVKCLSGIIVAFIGLIVMNVL